jgi:hypothetical protein
MHWSNVQRFYIQVVRGNNLCDATEEEWVQMQLLVLRILFVGQKLLGDDITRVREYYEKRRLELFTTKGLSTGNRKDDFRDYRGWIALCGLEQLPVTAGLDADTVTRICHIVRESK